MDVQKKEIGARLKEIRGEQKQRDFGAAADWAQQSISKYERGAIPGNWLFLARLAENENVDLNLLLTGRSHSESQTELTSPSQEEE